MPAGNGAGGLYLCAALNLVIWLMAFLVGTSGYSHAEWKGSFYPEKISQKKMLG
jgi:hypothetical protein